MEHPKVSILCITYGHENYIVETLNGFLMQRYVGPVEIILSNDRSPDNTDQVIKDFLDKATIPANFEIKYTVHEQNLGMMPNFIWALQQCTGKYIAMCEGDDYWIDPLKLQKQVDFLESNADYAIVSGKAQILQNEQLQEVIGDSAKKGSYQLADFLTHNNLITCTVLFKNSKIDYKTIENVYFGDWMLYVNILNFHAGKKAIVLDTVFSNYRVHSGGAMAKLNDMVFLEKHWLQIIEIHRFFKRSFSNEDKTTIKKYAVELYAHYLKKKQKSKALNVAKSCFMLLNTETPFRKFAAYYRYRNKLN